jgi:hypothetical protein
MRLRTLAICATCLFLLSTQYLKADIVVVYQSTTVTEISGHGKLTNSTVVTEKVKGSKIRTDIHFTDRMAAMLEQSTIADGESGNITVLFHGSKEFQVMTPEDQEAGRDMVIGWLGKRGQTKRPVLRPTGKHDTFDGHSVDEYVSEGPMGHFDFWIDKSMREYSSELAKTQYAAGVVGSVANLQVPDPASFPGVPIKIDLDQSSSGAGPAPGMKSHTEMKLLSLKASPLDDSDFTVPSGYHERKLPRAGRVH